MPAVPGEVVPSGATVAPDDVVIVAETAVASGRSTEASGDLAASGEPAVGRRRLPREWPLGLVTAALAAAVLLVATHHFRRGTALLALAVLLAAGLRLVLSDRRSGLLRVRSKTLDVLTLLALGLATGFLAVTVPLQH